MSKELCKSYNHFPKVNGNRKHHIIEDQIFSGTQNINLRPDFWQIVRTPVTRAGIVTQSCYTTKVREGVNVEKEKS